MKSLAGLVLVLSLQLHAQDSVSVVRTVFYFGGSDCPFSVDPQNIENINAMRASLPKSYPGVSFKFVLVVMDKDIQEGIKFAAHYPNWDELSIGSFYNNELMLAHVNQAAIPGVPHIMVYFDTLALGKFKIPRIRKRTLSVDLVGESAIRKWIQSRYPMKE